MFKQYILFLIFIYFNSSCISQNVNTMKKNKVDKNGKAIITAPVVVKNFIKKNGQPTGIKEFYVRRSVQDYFIKFCESNISKEDLEKHLEKSNDLIKTLTLEVEFEEGSWDICDGNYEQQSRIGKYIVIHRVIDKE